MVTNHDRFARAFENMTGKELTTKEIKHILHFKFPKMADGSMLPNDHAEGNKHPCWCAKSDKRIFNRIMRSKYLVK